MLEYDIKKDRALQSKAFSSIGFAFEHPANPNDRTQTSAHIEEVTEKSRNYKQHNSEVTR